MSLHREAAGEGPPVLLLHAGVADSRMWDAQWEALAREHRAIRCDLPGFGRSPVAEEPAVDADEVAAVLDAEGVEAADVVGASYGGLVALQLAARHPARVRRLVLLSPAWDLPPDDAFRRYVEEEGRLAEAGDLDGLVELNLRVWLTDEVAPQTRELVAAMQRRAFELQLAADVEAQDVAVELSQIAAETLIVTGGRDFELFDRVGAHLAHVLPDARRVHLPWAGHLPSLERPDELTALLLDALR